MCAGYLDHAHNFDAKCRKSNVYCTFMLMQWHFSCATILLFFALHKSGDENNNDTSSKRESN